MASEKLHEHTHGHATATREMRNAASAFVNSLSSEQKQQGMFEYMDGERIFWYYPPLKRHGRILFRTRLAERRGICFAPQPLRRHGRKFRA